MKYCEYCGEDLPESGRHDRCPVQLYGTSEQEKHLAKRLTILERQVGELKAIQAAKADPANIGECVICKCDIYIAQDAPGSFPCPRVLADGSRCGARRVP